MFFDTEPADDPAVSTPKTDPDLDEAMKQLPQDPDKMLKEIQGTPEDKKS